MAGLQPDIIHVHEWQLSAVPMLYWDHYHKQGLTRPRVMLTIHNMDSAGECRQDEFAYSGRCLPGSVPRALPLQQQQQLHRAAVSGTRPVLSAQSMLRSVLVPHGTGEACGRTFPLCCPDWSIVLHVCMQLAVAEGGLAADRPPVCAAAAGLFAGCKAAWRQPARSCLTSAICSSVAAGLPGEMFASPDKALDERTIGHNPERLSLMKASTLLTWHAFH